MRYLDIAQRQAIRADEIDIREKAFKALQARHAEYEANQRRRNRETAERIADMLRTRLGLDVGDPGPGPEVVVQGIRFALRFDCELVVLHTCERCGGDIQSDSIRDWADLGAALAGENLNRIWHNCPAARRNDEPDREPDVLSALREFVRQIVREEMES